LVASSGENEQVPLPGLTCNLGKQTRLAYACVARNEEEPWAVIARRSTGMRGHVGEPLEDVRENMLSPNERTRYR
jgi:hypothetical protein